MPSATLETLPPASARPDAPVSGARARPKLIGIGALLAGLALGWQGGAWGLLGATLAAAGTWFAFAARPEAAGSTTRHASHAGDAEADAYRAGHEVIVTQVVPVWSRQLEITRDAADKGLSRLLESFASMSGSIDTLIDSLGKSALSVPAGAAGEAVQCNPAIEALLEPTRRAFAQRDHITAELNRCGDTVTTLERLVKEARELSRHTRLVAFNASIEANRGGAVAGGSQSVANEVRMLANRLHEVAEKTTDQVGELQRILTAVSVEARVHETSAEELRLEIELRAHQALNGMLASFGASLQGSHDVRDASNSLRSQFEEAFTHFQFGDRMNQMMSILANDMSRFAGWVGEHPIASQSDAVEWLAALEASYTTDEQRTEHHGNVHIERTTEVEFF